MKSSHTAALLFLSASAVTASPTPYYPSSERPKTVSFPLKRSHGAQELRQRDPDAARSFAIKQANRLVSKYPNLQRGAPKGSERVTERDSTVPLTNGFQDSEYWGVVQAGTPAQSFNVILDTGSADLWIQGTLASTSTSSASASRVTSDSGFGDPFSSSSGTSSATGAQFSSTSSSTFKDTGSPFMIQYGSGQASGDIVTDTVTQGGFTVKNQAFAVVSQQSSGLLSGDVSGIMGMAFESIASTGAQPFWANADITEFAFGLTRYANTTSTSNTEPGGVLTLGGTNSTLYQGSINWVPLTSKSYWLVAMQGLKVNGRSMSSGTSSSVAIDTGTSLIGAPTAAVEEIYGNITGARAATGQYQGYYEFPCSSKPTVTFTFGGQDYTVSSDDMSVGAVDTSGTNCLGAVFAVDSSGSSSSSTSSSPEWIVGDSFLKNYYTAFRSGGNGTAAVGFAAPASNYQSLLRSAGESGVSSGTGTTTDAQASGAGRSWTEAGFVTMAAAVAAVAGLLVM